MPATEECVKEHAIRNLPNVKKKEMAPKVEALRVRLHIVARIYTLLSLFQRISRREAESRQPGWERITITSIVLVSKHFGV